MASRLFSSFSLWVSTFRIESHFFANQSLTILSSGVIPELLALTEIKQATHPQVLWFLGQSCQHQQKTSDKIDRGRSNNFWVKLRLTCNYWASWWQHSSSSDTRSIENICFWSFTRRTDSQSVDTEDRSRSRFTRPDKCDREPPCSWSRYTSPPWCRPRPRTSHKPWWWKVVLRVDVSVSLSSLLPQEIWKSASNQKKIFLVFGRWGCTFINIIHLIAIKNSETESSTASLSWVWNFKRWGKILPCTNSRFPSTKMSLVLPMQQRLRIALQARATTSGTWVWRARLKN